MCVLKAYKLKTFPAWNQEGRKNKTKNQKKQVITWSDPWVSVCLVPTTPAAFSCSVLFYVFLFFFFRKGSSLIYNTIGKKKVRTYQRSTYKRCVAFPPLLPERGRKKRKTTYMTRTLFINIYRIIQKHSIFQPWGRPVVRKWDNVLPIPAFSMALFPSKLSQFFRALFFSFLSFKTIHSCERVTLPFKP